MPPSRTLDPAVKAKLTALFGFMEEETHLDEVFDALEQYGNVHPACIVNCLGGVAHHVAKFLSKTNPQLLNYQSFWFLVFFVRSQLGVKLDIVEMNPDKFWRLIKLSAYKAEFLAIQDSYFEAFLADAESGAALAELFPVFSAIQRQLKDFSSSFDEIMHPYV